MISSLEYHLKTAYRRNDMDRHFLDWDNQPRQVKTYPSFLPTVPLPRSEEFTRQSLWKIPAIDSVAGSMDLKKLAEILDLTLTFTAGARHSSGDFYYRSAASAGALYPNEIYAAVDETILPDKGLYYYDLFRRSLTLLRKGAVLSLVEDALPQKKDRQTAATFFITAIFNRSAWKYRDRAYRYVLIDGGHLLCNLVFALNSANLTHEIAYDFCDHKINRLLEIDEEKEVCLACVHVLTPLGSLKKEGLISIPDPDNSLLSASRTAAVEIGIDLIKEIHDSGNIENLETDVHSRRFTGAPAIGPSPVDSKSILQNEARGILSYPDALFARRSKRNFIDKAIPAAQFMYLLYGLQRSGSDPHFGEYRESVAVGFLADNIDGLESGFYLCDLQRQSFGMVKAGHFQSSMTSICLDQNWLKNAGLHFLFMTDLQSADDLRGSRGYRYAMLEAGRMGQALYVYATALGLGCCGIGAFFDFEAQKQLSLQDNAFLLYLVSVGQIKA